MIVKHLIDERRLGALALPDISATEWLSVATTSPKKSARQNRREKFVYSIQGNPIWSFDNEDDVDGYGVDEDIDNG